MFDSQGEKRSEEIARSGISASAGISAADALRWKQMLDELYKRNGRAATPAEMLAYVRSKKGDELKHLFDFDDVEGAAEKYWEWRCSFFTRVVRVIVEEGEAPIRAIVRVTEADTGASGYVPIDALSTNADYRRQVLEEAARGLRNFEAKYLSMRRFVGSKKLDLALKKLQEAIVILNEK